MVTKESLNMLKISTYFKEPLGCNFNPCHAESVLYTTLLPKFYPVNLQHR